VVAGRADPTWPRRPTPEPAFGTSGWFVRERIGARDVRAVWDAATSDDADWLEPSLKGAKTRFCHAAAV
jgi:hypothetical protein